MTSLLGMDAGFILAIVAIFILMVLLLPYFSLMHLSDLSKLGDVAEELREIHEDLLKMQEKSRESRVENTAYNETEQQCSK